MEEEKWYFFYPDWRKFREIIFSEIPNYPGHILLMCETYKQYWEKRAYLELRSPNGEKLKSYDLNLSSKKSVEEFNAKLQDIVNLCDKLTTPKK